MQFTLIAAGAVTDFGSSEVRAMERAYGERFDVPRQWVAVSVFPASVLIAVEIKAASMAQATALVNSVNSQSAQSHAELLAGAGVSISIVSVAPATKWAVGAPPPPDAGDGSSTPVGLVVALGLSIALAVTLGGAALVACRRRLRASGDMDTKKVSTRMCDALYEPAEEALPTKLSCEGVSNRTTSFADKAAGGRRRTPRETTEERRTELREADDDADDARSWREGPAPRLTQGDGRKASTQQAKTTPDETGVRVAATLAACQAEVEFAVQDHRGGARVDESSGGSKASTNQAKTTPDEMEVRVATLAACQAEVEPPVQDHRSGARVDESSGGSVAGLSVAGEAGNRERAVPQMDALTTSWCAATSPDRRVYHYNDAGQTQWERGRTEETTEEAAGGCCGGVGDGNGGGEAGSGGDGNGGGEVGGGDRDRRRRRRRKGTHSEDAEGAVTHMDALPASWCAATSPDGRVYYYNTVSGQTQWMRPRLAMTMAMRQAMVDPSVDVEGSMRV